MNYLVILLPAAKFLMLLIGSVVAIMIGWIRFTRAMKRSMEMGKRAEGTKSSLKKLLSNHQTQKAQSGSDAPAKTIAPYDLPSPEVLRSDQPPESWKTFLRRNLHIVMFLSLSPGMFLAVLGAIWFFFENATRNPSLAGKALLAIPYVALPWVIVIGLAMLPFDYDSEHRFKLSDLFILLTIAAVTAKLFSGFLFGELLLLEKYFLLYLYYVVTMSIYGTVYWLRSLMMQL